MPLNKEQKSVHIVVMRLSAMGDVAMTVPILLALTQQYPQVRLTVISRPFFQPFFKEIPRLSFIGVDLKSKHKGVLGMFRLFKEIKKDADAFADLHNVVRSKIVAFLCKLNRIPVASVDKSRKQKAVLTALKSKKIEPITSIFDKQLAVLKTLGFPVNLSKAQLYSEQQIIDSAFDFLPKKNQKWIGVAPFAQYKTKTYPLNQIKQVIALMQSLDAKIVLFGGGKKEIEQLQKIESEFTNCISVAGRLSLAQELSVISNLDLMISMDSGNGHLAAMFGVNVITIWGNTHPYAGFVPFNQPLSHSLVPDLDQFPYLPTSIYGKKEVQGYEDCIATISPESIVLKVRDVLKI